MKFPIDKVLNRIFDEVEEEFRNRGVNRAQIKEIYYYLWYHTRGVMKTNIIPLITIPKWGRFTPKIKALIKKTYKLNKRDGKDNRELYKIFDTTTMRIANENTKRKRRKR